MVEGVTFYYKGVWARTKINWIAAGDMLLQFDITQQKIKHFTYPNREQRAKKLWKIETGRMDDKKLDTLSRLVEWMIRN